MMNIDNYPTNELSRKNFAKLLIQFLVLVGLLYSMFRASWWSFTQTLDFLSPAFKTATEAIVFSIIVQYGPQPALFFMGVFKLRLSVSQRDRDKWIAANRNNTLVPLEKVNSVVTSAVYLAIATLFFLGLSTIDFVTNLGEVNSTRLASNAGGTIVISQLLYVVMVSFAFFVLWAEELAGNLFVFFFMTCEQMISMFGIKNVSFSSAQKFFRKASGPLDMTDSISGQRPIPTRYPMPGARSGVTSRRNAVSSSTQERPIPRYHPVPVPDPNDEE